MGIYTIPCQQCGRPFLWFSGSLDQRCMDCKKAEVQKKLAESQTTSNAEPK
jgi:phage FluMu protein Com